MNVVDLRGASTGDAAGLAALAAALRSGARALSQDEAGDDGPGHGGADALADAAAVLDEVAQAMRATTDPADLPTLETRLVDGLHEPLHRLSVLRGADLPGTD